MDLQSRTLRFGGHVALAVALLALPWSLVVSRPVWPALTALAAAVSYGLLQQRRRVIAVRSAAATAQAEREEARSLIENAAEPILNALPIAVFLCDRKSVVLSANQSARTMFGFPEPGGKTVLAITLSYELDQLASRCLDTGIEQSAELAFSYPAEIVCSVRAWPNPDGERSCLSLLDITEMRRLERVRQDFVANVSHELRTPLTLIRAMTETLQDEPDDAALAKRYHGKIIEEADRLSAIAGDLLVLSAAESNPVRHHPCDLVEIVGTVAAQLQSKAVKKGLDLHAELPDSLVIAANPAQISQVVLNLVDNAINYTASGTVSAVLRQEGDRAVLTVSDSGIGIAREHHTRIFERFYRVDKGRSRGTGGTGLGLSIVRHIVEAHGGTVALESALNEGSTFVVSLPVGDPASAEPTQPSEA